MEELINLLMSYSVVITAFVYIPYRIIKWKIKTFLGDDLHRLTNDETKAEGRGNRFKTTISADEFYEWLGRARTLSPSLFLFH